MIELLDELDHNPLTEEEHEVLNGLEAHLRN
jgi:hypothetical protein